MVDQTNPQTSHGAMQCRECRCLNFNDSDYCSDCEAKRRQTAAVNGATAANGRSHMTSAGVLRLTNPIIQAQPRPQPPAAAGSSGNRLQWSTPGGVMTPHRTREGLPHQQTNGAIVAHGRAQQPPAKTGFVTPGRSFGPAIYGGLPCSNGPKTASTTAKAPTPQATGGAKINPPGSSVEPPSRAPSPASNIPRNRPTAPVSFSPPLIGSTATATTSNKRPRIEPVQPVQPVQRTSDVIDLISSDEDESEASVNRREAERVRQQQSISRLALRGAEKKEEEEEKEEQTVTETSKRTDAKPTASVPVTPLVEEDKDDYSPGELFQSRIFDEVEFNLNDFPANDVVVSTLRQHKRRTPASPASSVATNATTASFDEELIEPILQAASRAERKLEPTHSNGSRRPSVEDPSATAVPSGAVNTTHTPSRGVPQPPSQPQVRREPVPTAAPPRQQPSGQPAQALQPDTQPSILRPSTTQSTVTRPQVVDGPAPPQPTSQPPVSRTSDVQPPPPKQAAPRPQAPQPSPTQTPAPQSPAKQPEPPTRQATSTALAPTAAQPPSSAVSSNAGSSNASAPKLIVVDDSDDDDDDFDSSRLFQSRIFDSVEFNSQDFSGGEISAGRRSTVSVPPPSPMEPVAANEGTGVVKADPMPVPVQAPPSAPASTSAPIVAPTTAPMPTSAKTPVPESTSAALSNPTQPAVPTPVAGERSMRLVVAPPPAVSPPQATVSSQSVGSAPSAPRANQAVAPPPAQPVVPLNSPHVLTLASGEGGQTTVQNRCESGSTGSGVNVLKPRNKSISQSASRPPQSTTSVQGPPSSQSPIIKQEHPAKPRRVPVAKLALGYCSPDFLQFMRESMFDDEDPDDDEELARAKLLQVVDLTNSTDESGDEDEDDDEDDYFEIVVQRPAGLNARPAVGDVRNNDANPLGTLPGATSAGSNPAVIARIKRTPAPRPKEECVLCEESAWIKVLIHCETCLKYYHKRCAREYGDEAVCWNCDLDGMIDDSEVTEDHKKEVVGMFNMLRMSLESETEADDEEMKEGDEDEEDKAENPGNSSPISLSSIPGQKTRSMKRWKAFLEVATAPVEKGFEEATNQITTELQDETSKVKYSKGFVTKEIVEQAMAEVVDHYAALQDREERAQREERVLSPSTTASASPDIVDPSTSALDGSVAADVVERPSLAAETKAPATEFPASSTQPTPLVPPAQLPATSTVPG